MEDNIIHEKIGLLSSTVATPENSSKLDKESLHLFQTAIQFISSRLRNTVAILVQEADLTNAASDIENVVAYLNNFFGDENVGHLNNAKNSIKSAVSRLKNLPTLSGEGDFNFTKEVSTFKNIVTTKNAELDIEVGKLSSKIGELDSDILNRKTELENLEKLIADKKLEIEKLNKLFEDQYEKDRAEYIIKLGEQETLIKNNTNDLVEFLEKKKNEAAKIVNVIGNIGATGNFQLIATKHQTAANAWRVIALVFMTGLAGLVIWSVISLGSNEFDWMKSLLRIVAAAVLSYPATYAARESSKHRKLENFNRKLELELSSIEAFIELLPEEKKQNIKEKLAEKYFGSTLDAFEDTDLKSDKDYSLQGIERLFKAIEPLIKK
jgi:hypothetical protein